MYSYFFLSHIWNKICACISIVPEFSEWICLKSSKGTDLPNMMLDRYLATDLFDL